MNDTSGVQGGPHPPGGMGTAGAERKQKPIDETLEEFWSLKAPAWLEDWFPQMSRAMADGAWTAAWRGVAAFAPIVAFVIGLLSRFIFRDINVVFSESLLFLIVAIGGAVLSGPVGVMLLAGYIVEDLLVGNRVPSFLTIESTGASLPGVLGGKLVSYILLSIPCVTIPLLAKQLSENARLRTIADPNVRFGALVGLNAAICGILVYLWAQSAIVLLRPLFTWVGAVPTTEAIQNVQNSWLPLVVVAALAGGGRVALEEVVVPRAPRARVATTLQRQSWTGEGKGVLERVPGVVRVAVASATITVVLAGTYDSWIDAVIVALISGVLGLWRANLLQMIPIPMGWAVWVRRVPPLVRLLVAPVIGYFLSTAILTPSWMVSTGLRPVMLGALLTLVVFYALFPPLPVQQGAVAQGRTSA